MLIFNMKILSRFVKSNTKNEFKSYSQCGEDRIIKHIFYALNIEKPSYLDIGAYHPFFLSNTYLFYQGGGRGVLIEPDPTLYRKIIKKRKKDVCLNIGIGDGSRDKAEFFIMSVKTLNTFDQAEAKRIQNETKVKIEKSVTLSIKGINAILKKYFSAGLDLLSIDVEGLDLKILRTINFSIVRPTVVCVETITYSENRKGKKLSEVSAYMTKNGYFPYADTYINTIFVDLQKW